MFTLFKFSFSFKFQCLRRNYKDSKTVFSPMQTRIIYFACSVDGAGSEAVFQRKTVYDAFV